MNGSVKIQFAGDNKLSKYSSLSLILESLNKKTCFRFGFSSLYYNFSVGSTADIVTTILVVNTYILRHSQKCLIAR